MVLYTLIKVSCNYDWKQFKLVIMGFDQLEIYLLFAAKFRDVFNTAHTSFVCYIEYIHKGFSLGVDIIHSVEGLDVRIFDCIINHNAFFPFIGRL